MKILFVGNTYDSVTAEPAEESQIVKDFRVLGHEVEFVERSEWKEKCGQLPTEGWTFIFVANYHSIEDEAIRWLKERFNCPLVYWTPDFTKAPEFIPWYKAEVVDLWLCKQREYQRHFEDHNVNWLYWPYDVAMDVFQRDDTIPPEMRIYFEGTLPPQIPIGITFNWVHDPFRMKMVWAIQQQIPDLWIHTFSRKELINGQISTGDPATSPSVSKYGLKNVGHNLCGKYLNPLVARTKVNLAIDWAVSEGYWSNRIARYMCAGGFVLSYYTKGMERVFKDYIEYFTTVDEAVEKTRYFLEHEEERKTKAERGYQYADKNLRGIERAKELIIHLENTLCRKHK